MSAQKNPYRIPCINFQRNSYMNHLWNCWRNIWWNSCKNTLKNTWRNTYKDSWINLLWCGIPGEPLTESLAKPFGESLEVCRNKFLVQFLEESWINRLTNIWGKMIMCWRKCKWFMKSCAWLKSHLCWKCSIIVNSVSLYENDGF